MPNSHFIAAIVIKTFDNDASNFMIKTDTSPHVGKTIRTPKPLYEQVKSYVMDNITSGNWPTFHQIPSEHTMVREMGISRMTIHRALRELTQDGYLDRIQGVGTFVAKTPQKKIPMEIDDIDISIKKQGHHYQCDILFLQAEPISAEYAVRMGLREGEQIFRSYLLHRKDGVAVMLEDRHTNPSFVPNYLEHDFTQQSSDGYFRSTFNMLSHDHQLLACTSTPEIHHFMALEHPTPCVQINRRTWSGNKILSVGRFLYHSERYQILW